MAVRLWIRELLHRKDSGFFGKLALYPLAGAGLLYGAIQKLRRSLYKSGALRSYHAGVPTICVGNITVGGTGKTPLVAEVCRLLREMGVKPAVVTRGYRGSLKGRLSVVSNGKRVLLDPTEAGDEPVLLAWELPGVPVIAGADRRASSALARERFGAQAIVMDDGFQHLRLRRDMNIVVVDATRPFGSGHCLPRGILREPLGALAAADLFVLSRSDRVEPSRLAALKKRLGEKNPDALILEAVHAPSAVRDLYTDELRPLDTLVGRKVLAFAGIGYPEAFFLELRDLGAKVVESVPFPDHHPFSREDIDRLVKWSSLTNAEALVTTEKDGVRLKPFLPFPRAVWTVTIHMALGEAGTDLLAKHLARLFGGQYGEMV